MNADGTVVTIAGGGTSSKDNVPAPTESLSVSGVGADAAGNVYITDNITGCIRQINGNGLISTVACLDASTFAGFPSYANLAVDSTGSTYAATFSDQVIKVSAGGNVTLIAGNGKSGLGGDGGPAPNAQLVGAAGVALGPDGSLYIADQTVVHRVTPDGTIHVVAGTGNAGFSGDGGPASQAQLSGASAVALDSKGNLYIADSGNNNVRVVSSSGIINTFAGTGLYGFSGDGLPAALANFTYAGSVAIDSSDVVYIADEYTVRKISPGSLPGN